MIVVMLFHPLLRPRELFAKEIFVRVLRNHIACNKNSI